MTPGPRVLLAGATVIDGTGAAPCVADVVIQDGLILDVGPGLDGDECVALGGLWLLPGFIDCHVHLVASGDGQMEHIYKPFSLMFYEAAVNMRTTLGAGITSVLDAGGADLGMKAALGRGILRGPRLKICVSILSPTGGHYDMWMPYGATVPEMVPHPGRPDGLCDGHDAVLRKTREVVRAGADFIKICTTGGILSPTDNPMSSQFLSAEIETIVAEARASGRFVVAHALGTSGIKNALRAGVRCIAHGAYLDDEAIELMVEKQAFLVPTLAAPTALLEHPELLSASALAQLQEAVESHSDSISRAISGGIKIAMGSDAGVFPHGRNLEELGLLVEAGLAPMAALESATRVAAECLGAPDRGVIAPGLAADLVTLRLDPLTNIKRLSSPACFARIWVGGHEFEKLEDPRGPSLPCLPM